MGVGRGGGRGGVGGVGRFGFWFLVGPPEATAKPKGGRRKIAAPNRPQGALLGPARVGRSGQRVTAQPAPPRAVTGRKRFAFWGWGGLRVALVVVDFLGGGGGGGATWGCAWAQRGAAQGCGAGLLHSGAARHCAGVPQLRRAEAWGFAGAQHGA